jgi:MFS family permease
MLRAQFYNDIASGGVVAAVIGPIFGLLLDETSVNWWGVSGLFLLALVISLIMHDAAYRIVRAMEDADER